MNNKYKFIYRAINLLLFYLCIVNINIINARKNYNKNNDELENIYSDITKKLVDIWSQIDLVRAINITTIQKEEFINRIFVDILDVYLKYEKFLNIINNYNFNYAIELEKLIKIIACNYYDIFSDSNNHEVLKSFFILNKFTERLKNPGNIDSKVATNHTSIIDPFTCDAVVI